MSYREFIKHFPEYTFLKHLFDDNRIHFKTWQKGEFVCHSQSPMKNLYFFTSGRGKVYRQLINGKEIIYEIYRPGMIAGDVEYILSGQTTCSLESLDNLSACVLSFSLIDRELSSLLFPLLSKEVAKKLIANSVNNSIRLGYPLEERLAHYLLNQYDSTEISMGELALQFNTTYRHLSRVIKKFTNDGILTVINRVIHIHKGEILKKLSSSITEEF